MKNSLAGLLLLFCTWPALADDILQFGIFPHLSPHQLMERYFPLADALSGALGQPILLKTTRDFKSFQEKINQEQYDIVLVQPLFYPESEAHHYHAVVQLAQSLKAILLVRQKSKITSVSELKGQVVAMPSPLAAVARLFQHELSLHGLTFADITPLYTKSHSQCYQALLTHSADACISADRSYISAAKATQAQIQVVEHFGEIPHVLLMVHERVQHKLITVTSFLRHNPIVTTVLGGAVKAADPADLLQIKALMKDHE